MKKNRNILDYVEKYKYKYGISYAEDGGKLVNTMSVLMYIAWVYAFIMTAFFALGTAFRLSSDNADFGYIANSFITILSCAVVMIAGFVLCLCRKKIIGCALNAAAQPFMFFAYLHITRDSAGQLNSSFYWRHAIPAVAIFLLAVLIIAVIIRAKIKTNKIYTGLVEGLYKQYGTKDGEKLTEQELQEFLDKYNPYKPIA